MPSPVTEPSVLDALIKQADMPNPLNPDVTEKIRNSGAGFLADLVKQAERDGQTVDLTGTEARDSGAGFVQDILRTIEEPPPEPAAPDAIVSISNEAEAVVTVDPLVAANYTAGSTVKFAGTGNATLDAENADYYVLSNDGVTFTVNADLSAEAAPITQGTVVLV